MATLLAPSRTDRAFERLYRRYVADVYRYVLAVLQNEADAEDATQTAFLAAYRAYERGERPERPQHWLIAIAHNVCRQRFRESARRPRLVELNDDVAARPSDEETPNADEIRRALGFLAFNQRAALVLRELRGHSYDEIGALLGLSGSAVETLLFRARRAMREQLEGALTCAEAEHALSKRADGVLSFAERGHLRAHLRECPDCAALERGQRFRRRALRSLGLVPVPSSLGSFFGGAAVGTGVGVGAKAAAVVAAGVLGTGLAGDEIRGQRAGHDKASTDTQSRSAPVQQQARVPQASVAARLSFRRATPARRRPSMRRGESTRAVIAPVATQPASSLPVVTQPAPSLPVVAQPAPPFAGATPGASSNPPEAVEASQPPVSAAPGVPGPADLPDLPSRSVPPPPPPAAPPVPELPQPPSQLVLPPPKLPSLPRPPELPKITPPTVKLPETPRVDVPPTPTVIQP
jgi:RNA polymerase sigma-70 factor, ECF subfamily